MAEGALPKAVPSMAHSPKPSDSKVSKTKSVARVGRVREARKRERRMSENIRVSAKDGAKSGLRKKSKDNSPLQERHRKDGFVSKKASDFLAFVEEVDTVIDFDLGVGPVSENVVGLAGLLRGGPDVKILWGVKAFAEYDGLRFTFAEDLDAGKGISLVD